MNTDPDVKIGDRVHHADTGSAVAILKRYWSFPLVVVEWESTGRESTENVYLLIKVDD